MQPCVNGGAGQWVLGPLEAGSVGPFSHVRRGGRAADAGTSGAVWMRGTGPSGHLAVI